MKLYFYAKLKMEWTNDTRTLAVIGPCFIIAHFRAEFILAHILLVIEQRGALFDKQCETELPSVSTEHCPASHLVADSKCNTIKMEPT